MEVIKMCVIMMSEWIEWAEWGRGGLIESIVADIPDEGKQCYAAALFGIFFGLNKTGIAFFDFFVKFPCESEINPNGRMMETSTWRKTYRDSLNGPIIHAWKAVKVSVGSQRNNHNTLGQF